MATSVPSERLFSVAGNIVSAKRAALLPENVEKLVFLHENASVCLKYIAVIFLLCLKDRQCV